MVSRILDLTEIERSLRTVQRDYASINRRLNGERAEFSDQVLRNLLAGYRMVDALVHTGVDLFSLGNSHSILELNNVVLYGPAGDSIRQRYAAQLLASERHFYEVDEGGVGDLIEFHQRRHFGDSRDEAASIYVRMLTRPQLFIEGNHRTGALLISYILVRDGQPPFVLTPENAKDFFDPSAAIGRIKKRSLAMILRGRRLRRHFIGLLERTANPAYLVRSGPSMNRRPRDGTL